MKRTNTANKKLIRKICNIVASVLAIIALFYIWVINYTPSGEYIERPEALEANVETVIIEDGTVITQYFSPMKGKIVSIQLLIQNPNECTTGEIAVILTDLETEKETKSALPLEKVKSGEYTDFDVNARVKSECKVEIVTEGIESTNQVAVMLTTMRGEEAWNGKCLINDEERSNQYLAIGYKTNRKQEDYMIKRQVDFLWTIVILIILYFVIVATKKGRLTRNIVQLIQYKNATQFAKVLLYIDLFLVSAIHYNRSIERNVPITIYGFVFLTLFVILVVLVYGVIRKKYRKKIVTNLGTIKEKLLDPYRWIICASVILPRLFQLNDTVHSDAMVYYSGIYNAIKYFDFTLASLPLFNLAGHPTILFSMTESVGEFWFPAQIVGVHLINLVLTVIAMLMVYEIMLNFGGLTSPKEAALGTILVSVLPVFLGTFSHINVDYLLFPFFIFMIYAWYEDQEIMMFFYMLMLALCKETGWVIVAGFWLFYITWIWMAIPKKKLKNKMRVFFRQPICQLIMFFGLLMCLALIARGGIVTWLGSATHLFTTKAEIMEEGYWYASGVGFIPSYIGYRLLQIFLLHFNWIPVLIILLAHVLPNTRKRVKFMTKRMLILILPFSLFTLFSVLYVTFPLSRYTIFSAVLLWIMAYIYLINCYSKYIPRNILQGISVGLMAILLVQNLYSMDVLTNVIFKHLNTGRGNLVLTSDDDNIAMELAVTNYRINYLDQLYDKVLREYNTDGIVYVVNNEVNQTYLNSILSWYGWDNVQKKRRMYVDDNLQRHPELQPIALLNVEDYVIGSNGHYFAKADLAEQLPETMLMAYESFSQIDEDTKQKWETVYTIGEPIEVKNWGGTLTYHILTKKSF